RDAGKPAAVAAERARAEEVRQRGDPAHTAEVPGLEPIERGATRDRGRHVPHEERLPVERRAMDRTGEVRHRRRRERAVRPAELGQRRLEDRDVDTSARDVELPRSMVGEVLAGTRPLGPSAYTKLARRAAVDVEHAEMDLFVVSGDRRRGRDREDAAEGEPRPV